jgi:DNA-binding MarR family transcriptional regulator
LAAAIELRRVVVAWDSALQQYGITLAQASVLAYLKAAGETAMGELAEAEGVTPAVITGRVDRLERVDLLRRGPGRGDRRVTMARLTPAGEALLDKLDRELPSVIS